jgi:Fe-S cluster assembly protein SufD
MSAAVEFDVREQAALRFKQLGWPTTKLEEWKYTNVAPIATAQWRFDDEPVADRRLGNLLDATLRGKALAELIFVNGRLHERAGSAPGLQVVPLSEASSYPLFERHYGRYADYQRHAFTALNTANAQDGAFIVVPEGASPAGFIHILFVGSGDGIWSHPRTLIVAGRGSQITVVESFVGTGKYFTNAVTEIVAGDGAHVDHYKVERESNDAFHVGTVQIHQERSSNVTARCVSLGGGLVRNEVNVALAGEGAGLTLDGLFILADTQHVDNHTVIDHVMPHCDSLELYKGILDDNSRGIFDGTIIVRPDARKTNSRQVNRNLLLSETAIIDSKPTLEIHNDDVKCSHGSTIGQLDEEAMFYLRARGIGESEARSLLIYAFASEVVDRMKVDAVKEQIRGAMFRRIARALPERRSEPR